ncbi:hypothetical protein [Litchfieldia salsa]|nr:hypothetical protein [Litchfieldia salsa]
MNLIAKNKKVFLFIILIIFIIAGILDIKYEGLIYQLLPNSIQSQLTDIF